VVEYVDRAYDLHDGRLKLRPAHAAE
jgi:hypothetical protein